MLLSTVLTVGAPHVIGFLPFRLVETLGALPRHASVSLLQNTSNASMYLIGLL